LPANDSQGQGANRATSCFAIRALEGELGTRPVKAALRGGEEGVGMLAWK
jgi:hypothetical protein